METCIYKGSVTHRRFKPIKHYFSYRTFSILFDLDELKNLQKKISLFSYNKFNLFSFYNKDHGDRSGDNLSATFDIELSIPEEADFDACNTLQGEVNAEKEEPMAESLGAAGDSNHAKLIKTWQIASVTFSGEDGLSRFLGEPCIYEDANGEDGLIEGCSNANSLALSVSAFGSYSLVWIGSSEGTYVETDLWYWLGTDFTSFYTGDSENGEVVEIISLTGTEAVFAVDGGVYTFIAQ